MYDVGDLVLVGDGSAWEGVITAITTDAACVRVRWLWWNYWVPAAQVKSIRWRREPFMWTVSTGNPSMVRFDGEDGAVVTVN